MKKPGPPQGPPAETGPTKSPSKSRSGRRLSDTEHALWRHAASSLKPLKGAKARVHAALENEPQALSGKHESHAPNLKRGASPARPMPVHVPTTAVVHQPPPPPARKSPPLADFDAKRARKLRSGQVEIDARIDLHGMRQSEAHTALRGFLHACHRKGHSVVLVITGKGAPAGTKPEGPWGDAMGRSERGVLRRNVPQWLSDPDLRAIVVSFTAAAIRHGGDGALYVHLRRKLR